MAGQTREQVEALNGRLSGAVKLAVVPVHKVRRLKKNARFMRSETFRQLVENVKRDGCLTQLPFCVKEGDEYECLSGNHRTEAAEAAGLAEILVLYTDRELSRQERVAIQLSHNAIAGEDDPAILRELWQEIDDIALKFYSGLDDKKLEELAKATVQALSEVRLDFRTLSFIFLPEECSKLDEVLDAALERLKTSSGGVRLARLAEFDRVLNGLARLKKVKGIKSASTALAAIFDWFERQQIPGEDGPAGPGTPQAGSTQPDEHGGR